VSYLKYLETLFGLFFEKLHKDNWFTEGEKERFIIEDFLLKGPPTDKPSDMVERKP